MGRSFGLSGQGRILWGGESSGEIWMTRNQDQREFCMKGATSAKALGWKLCLLNKQKLLRGNGSGKGCGGVRPEMTGFVGQDQPFNRKESQYTVLSRVWQHLIYIFKRWLAGKNKRRKSRGLLRSLWSGRLSGWLGAWAVLEGIQNIFEVE